MRRATEQERPASSQPTAPGYDRSDPATVSFTVDKCDVNQDGTIDVADIATIIDRMAGR